MRRPTFFRVGTLAIIVSVVAGISPHGAWGLCSNEKRNRLREGCEIRTKPLPDSRGTLKERDKKEWTRFLGAMEASWTAVETRRIASIGADLRSDDPAQRSVALSRIAQEQPPADAVVGDLLPLLRSDSDDTRIEGLRALARYPGDTRGLRQVLALASDPAESAGVRSEAFAALAEIKPGDPAVVSATIEVLRDPRTTFSIQRAAIAVLDRAGTSANDALPVLSTLLDSPFSAVQADAKRAIDQIQGRETGAQRAAVTPPADRDALASAAARDVRGRREGHARAEAIEQLGALGLGRPDAAQALLEVIGSDDSYLRDLATRALARIEPGDAAAVDALAAGVRAPKAQVRRESARALRVLGLNAEPALPALVEAFAASTGATDHYEVGAYLDAIRAVGAPALHAVPAIVARLDPESPLLAGRGPITRPMLAGYMFAAAAELGPTDEALDAAIGALRDDAKWTDAMVGRVYLIAGASRVVAAFGPKAAAAVPSLLAVLAPDFQDHFIDLSEYGKWMSAETSARLEAIRALGAIGAPAAGAVPVLSRLAKTPDADAMVPMADEARAAVRSIRGHKRRHRRS